MKKKNYLTIGLFIFYLAAVVWIILFKLSFTFETFGIRRSINLIPFAGSVIVNGKVHIAEIFNNILIFVPFGIYISMLKKDWSFVKKVIPAFLVSLALETLQYLFAAGASDITDLIGNTLGGVIGIVIYYLLSKVLREKTNRVVNVLAFVSSAAMSCLICILIVTNL